MNCQQKEGPERIICATSCPSCGADFRFVIVEGEINKEQITWEGKICTRCHHGMPDDINFTRVHMG